MLPHLLTLTPAAVPELTLIHPDCHLLGKKKGENYVNASIPKDRKIILERQNCFFYDKFSCIDELLLMNEQQINFQYF